MTLAVLELVFKVDNEKRRITKGPIGAKKLCQIS